MEFYYPNATMLRRNPIFYQVYCVALNTCFATLLPLLALLYLNVATLIALNKLSQASNSIELTERNTDRRMSATRYYFEGGLKFLWDHRFLIEQIACDVHNISADHLKI